MLIPSINSHHVRIHLQEARTSRRWSQQEVASSIGTTHVNVSRWERGITSPGPYFRDRLCQLFGKSAEELDLRQVTAPKEEARVEEIQWPAGSDPAVPSRLPIPLRGRNEELEASANVLLQGLSIAIFGLPGVGKTALCIALTHAERVRAHFRDGIFWVSLGPNPDLPTSLRRWGTLLGVPDAQMEGLNTKEALVAALSAAIGHRSLLLVIDDVWDTEDAQTFCSVGGPNCVYLLNGRFPSVATLLSSAHLVLSLQELEGEESMEMLRLLAPHAMSLEEPACRDLVAGIGGLPLAIFLLGNYLHVQGRDHARLIRQALRQMASADAVLALSNRLLPDEHHARFPADSAISYATLLHANAQLLGPQEKSALIALATLDEGCGSPFTGEAAQTRTGCSPSTFHALVDAGFVSVKKSGYCLHPLVGTFVRHVLSSGQKS